MRLLAGIPSELVDGWEESQHKLQAGHRAGHHYHDVDEWLTVVRGSMTFFTLADTPFHVDSGQALRIPRGEVHRAEVGPEDVEYTMKLPVASATFRNELTSVELDALRRNLEFPEYEDGRRENPEAFFEEALSDQLVLCRATGAFVDKEGFIKSGFTGRGRSSAGTVEVLNRAENGLLISTVVNMANAQGGVDSFTNIRFLAAEDGSLRCRLWANFPAPGGPGDGPAT